MALDKFHSTLKLANELNITWPSDGDNPIHFGLCQREVAIIKGERPIIDKVNFRNWITARLNIYSSAFDEIR